jgi:alkylhydroperoxidase/carboxymuconolactone decarboxylase family protein YurZ
LIEINGQEINIPEKNDWFWEFIFKDDIIVNATGNVKVKYI